MTLHAATDYGGAFEYMDDPDDLFTLDTLYALLNAMKDHDHALDKGTPIKRVDFGIEADRPTTTPNEGWVWISTDTHALWFADGAQWNQVFVLSDETIPVSAGGTGDSTIPIHTVLLGNDANPINHTAVGPDHSLLQGHTGSDPTYETHPVVDGLTVDGDLEVTGAFVGGLMLVSRQSASLATNINNTNDTYLDIHAGLTTPVLAAGEIVRVIVNCNLTLDVGADGNNVTAALVVDRGGSKVTGAQGTGPGAIYPSSAVFDNSTHTYPACVILDDAPAAGAAYTYKPQTYLAKPAPDGVSAIHNGIGFFCVEVWRA